MIDYDLLNKSIIHYEGCGFTRIESPWLVTEYVDAITRPKNGIPYNIPNKNKNFVASGEQSLLYLYLKEYLPMGKFQTITPCLRNDTFDYTHTKYFMKNELINTENTSYQKLLDMVQNAEDFFNNLLPEKVDIVDTESGFDLEYKGIELGSYGIRECEFLKWIYGTGCAEPRTSKIIKYGVS
tara:strand:- start:62098 stop:62643 length:546 start_codon:yes stop_codon:yes gene_type:complete